MLAATAGLFLWGDGTSWLSSSERSRRRFSVSENNNGDAGLLIEEKTSLNGDEGLEGDVIPAK